MLPGPADTSCNSSADAAELLASQCMGDKACRILAWSPSSLRGAGRRSGE